MHTKQESLVSPTLKPWSKTPTPPPRECEGDEWECVLCRRPLTPTPRTLWIHVVDGGARFANKGETGIESAGDMGFFPVGPECGKSHADALVSLATEHHTDLETNP